MQPKSKKPPKGRVGVRRMVAAEMVSVSNGTLSSMAALPAFGFQIRENPVFAFKGGWVGLGAHPNNFQQITKAVHKPMRLGFARIVRAGDVLAVAFALRGDGPKVLECAA